jgi:hypothetical protein
VRLSWGSLMRRVSWSVNVASVCAILQFLVIVTWPPAETSVDSGSRLQSAAGLSAHNQSRERSEWVLRAPMTDPQPATRVHVRVWAGTMFTLEQRLEASFEHCRQVPHSAAPASLPRENSAGRPTVPSPRFGNQSLVHQYTDARKRLKVSHPVSFFQSAGAASGSAISLRMSFQRRQIGPHVCRRGRAKGRVRQGAQK